MKSITKSLLMITAVAALAIGGTVAYFSDTEISTGNTISAGTIDISVDGQNPWSKTYLTSLPDFKPGVTQTIQFPVKNEGTNPAVIRKMLGNYALTTGMNEPKCVALSGTWSGSTCSVGATEDITKVILYDMFVSTDNGATWTTVIPDSWNVHMSDIKSLYVPLGTLAPSATMLVKQSYKLEETADNTYQGDSLKFDITLYAEQREGLGVPTTDGVVLDNKTGAPDWYNVVDGTMAFFSYDPVSHNYTARAFGLDPGVNYRLTYRTTGNPVDLVTGTAAGDGTLTLTGNQNLNGSTGVFVDLMYGASLWGNDTKNLWQGNATNL